MSKEEQVVLLRSQLPVYDSTPEIRELAQIEQDTFESDPVIEEKLHTIHKFYTTKALTDLLSRLNSTK